ncbi:DUF2254 domain-containing protein [Belnapia sp. T18]|uniref:DUF2254 domain-containing protein n=1 Tax=Belnapia arida TaxID=2804533 RepID=A0ABS1UCT5_9PROT|nr:DUF2254 domain-containing protein [Belnapia arida]
MARVNRSTRSSSSSIRRLQLVRSVPSRGDAASQREALSLGDRQTAAQDLEFAVRQLAEVAVRALSPDINDPFTAMAVLDRFGDVLCGMTDRHLPGSAVLRDGRAVLFRRAGLPWAARRHVPLDPAERRWFGGRPSPFVRDPRRCSDDGAGAGAPRRAAPPCRPRPCRGAAEPR